MKRMDQMQKQKFQCKVQSIVSEFLKWFDRGGKSDG
jgi:hypothetical protein